MKRKLTVAVIAVLLISLFGFAGCAKDDGMAKGKYYPINDEGTGDKTSYIEVVDKDTMILNNIDATDYIASTMDALAEMNGSVKDENIETGETKELDLKSASAEERAEYIELQKKAFDGKRKYSITVSGDVNMLYFEGDTMSIGEYIPKANKITIAGNEYQLAD